MDFSVVSELLREALERARPAAPPTGIWPLLALAAGLLCVGAPPLWRLTRVVVTLVHELGHAVVGVLMGRRFTGFQVRGDMSGHAVTVGPRRGPGRVLTTAAGYPAPAVVGLLLITAGVQGWAPTVLAVALAALVVGLPFSRSLLTVMCVLGAGAAVLGAWWWGGTVASAALALGAGCLLLLGAWRHLGAVMSGGRRQDDPQVLADLTGLPAGAWNVLFMLVIAACTYGAGRQVLTLL